MIYMRRVQRGCWAVCCGSWRRSAGRGCTSFSRVAEEAEEVKHWVERCIREEPVVGIGVGAGGHSRSFPISYHPQKQTGCLGERMVDAFSFVEAQGHTWIGIFGTDVPDLANEIGGVGGTARVGLGLWRGRGGGRGNENDE